MRGFTLGTTLLVALAGGCSSSGTAGTTTTTGGATGGASSGGTTGGTTGSSTITVTISNYNFSPGTVMASPGDTIVFNNTDVGIKHTATSEAAAGDFMNAAAPGGWIFDVAPDGGASASIVVPTGLASGTIQPYYCGIHTTMMTPSDPTIQIR
jgi:plastocyanin